MASGSTGVAYRIPTIATWYHQVPTQYSYTYSFHPSTTTDLRPRSSLTDGPHSSRRSCLRSRPRLRRSQITTTWRSSKAGSPPTQPTSTTIFGQNSGCETTTQLGLNRSSMRRSQVLWENLPSTTLASGRRSHRPMRISRRSMPVSGVCTRLCRPR